MLLSMLAPPGTPSPEELIKFLTENKTMDYVVVKDGIVIDRVVWDGVAPFTYPGGGELHPCDGARIGWLWVDGASVDPNPPPPAPELSSTPSEGPTVI